MGAKLSVTELTQKVRDDGLYENMSQTEINQLIAKLDAEKASKVYGKRSLAHEKVADVSTTLAEVEASVS